MGDEGDPGGMLEPQCVSSTSFHTEFFSITASPTGLFKASGTKGRAHISGVGEPISKPFDMVRVNTGRFGFMYHNP